jgi:tetratricopeptide (TPR) repeat protein
MTKVFIVVILTVLFAACSSQKEVSNDEGSPVLLQKGHQTDKEKEALVHFINGSVLESKGQYAEAILEFQDALRLDPSAGIYYALAKNYRIINKIPLALQHCKKAIELSPRKVEYYDLLADIFSSAHQYDSAAVVLEKIIEIDSTQLNSYYKLARIYESSRPLQAIATYNKLTEIIGPDYNVLIRVAELQESLGNLNKAAEAIEELLTIDPSNTSIQKLLSEIYAKDGKYEEALKIINEIIEFNPDDLDARERKAQLLIQQNEWGAAADEYNYILEKPDVSLETKIRVGVSFFAQSFKDSVMLQHAKQLFETINKDTADWQVKMYLGAIALVEENDSVALDYFNEVKDLARENAQAWTQLGGLFFDNRHYREAITLMSTAVELFPQNFVVNLLLGLSLAQSGKHSEAKDYLKTAVDINPQDVVALSAYGFSLNQLKEYDEAIFYIKRALKFNPDDVNLLGTLGLIYDSLEMWEKCDSTYERALEIDSANATVNNNYAYSLSERGIRLDEALAMVKIAIEKDPENSSFLDTIGWVYYKLGNYQEAKMYLEKALEIGGERPVMLDHLGDVLFRMGEKNLAVEFWQKAYKLDSSNSDIKTKIEKGEI